MEDTDGKKEGDVMFRLGDDDDKGERVLVVDSERVVEAAKIGRDAWMRGLRTKRTRAG